MKGVGIFLPAAFLGYALYLAAIGRLDGQNAVNPHLLVPAVALRNPAAANGAGPSKGAGDQEQVIRFAKNPPPVPPFLIVDVDGNPVSTAAWDGKVVLLTFWATWCGPCRAEIPDLIRLQSQYKDRLLVVGISIDEIPPAQVREFAKKAGVNYAIAMGTRDLERAFGGVGALPTTFLVDSKGGVVQRLVGLYSYAFIEMEVRALLGMSVPARVETFEDHGQIFPQHATELPGVSFAGLSAAQKKAALREMNETGCNCGCGMSVAQCRINDPSCPISTKLASEIVKKVKSSGATPSSVEPSAH